VLFSTRCFSSSRTHAATHGRCVNGAFMVSTAAITVPRTRPIAPGVTSAKRVTGAFLRARHDR
jgi:hypothetical protein